jgi:outer membrane immunogenic protein
MHVKRGMTAGSIRRAALLLALAVPAAGALSVNSTAYAADVYTGGGSLKDSPDFLPLSPAWQGFYAGGRIGGAWGDVDVSNTYTYIQDPTVDSSISTSGVIGGGQIGYNLQSGNVVYGLEADLGVLDLSGSGATQLQGGRAPLTATYSASGGFYGDITGRLGYAVGRTLFYAKGGAAFLNADFDSHYTGKYAEFDYQDSDTFWGWTIGGGVEYKLRPGWSLKVEYQHFDFGDAAFSHNTSQNFDCGLINHHWRGNMGCHSDLTTDAKVSPTVDAVTVGVNYHFGHDDGRLK